MIKARALGSRASPRSCSPGAAPAPSGRRRLEQEGDHDERRRAASGYSTGRAEAMAQADVGRLREVAGGRGPRDRRPSADRRSMVGAKQGDRRGVRSYPMWFVSVSDIADEDVRVAAVFSRASSRRALAAGGGAEAGSHHGGCRGRDDRDGTAVVDDGTAPCRAVSRRTAREAYATLSDPASPSPKSSPRTRSSPRCGSTPNRSRKASGSRSLGARRRFMS